MQVVVGLVSVDVNGYNGGDGLRARVRASDLLHSLTRPSTQVIRASALLVCVGSLLSGAMKTLHPVFEPSRSMPPERVLWDSSSVTRTRIFFMAPQRPTVTRTERPSTPHDLGEQY